MFDPHDGLGKLPFPANQNDWTNDLIHKASRDIEMLGTALIFIN